jgi:two-component system chemotaxis response regulator CheY
MESIMLIKQRTKLESEGKVMVDQTASPRILIVDDEDPIRTIYRKLLVKAGYDTIAEARNGEEALAICAEFKPDLITMDIQMGGIDGLDTTREIKKLLPDVKIIVITGISKPSNVSASLRMGAVNFLSKPFKSEHFIRVVNNTLGRV